MATKLQVERHDIASGHVVFRAGTEKLPLEQRPALLEATMLQWLKQHPEFKFKVRATAPITSWGHTVAIHIWFEYALPTLMREQRAGMAKVQISANFNAKQQAFLDFVLAHYVDEGVQELDQDKLTP